MKMAYIKRMITMIINPNMMISRHLSDIFVPPSAIIVVH